jgi:hypothetical protein
MEDSEGFNRKNSKNKSRCNYKARPRVSVDRNAKVKVIMLDKKEQLETFLTNSRYVVC